MGRGKDFPDESPPGSIPFPIYRTTSSALHLLHCISCTASPALHLPHCISCTASPTLHLLSLQAPVKCADSTNAFSNHLLTFQIFLNTQQLIVFGHAVRTAGSAGLNLPALTATAISAMMESSVSPGTLGYNGAESGPLSHFDSLKAFRQRTILIHLHQNGVSCSQLNAL